MRVALDAQLAVGTATGIGEYVIGLVAALRERGIEVSALEEPRLDPWRFDRRVVWDQVLLPQRARRTKAQLLHCASGTMPRAATFMPVVVTVHDVAWLRSQRHARWYARRYFGAFALSRYRRAAAILVDSAFSRAELLALAPGIEDDRVRVAYPGVARDFCEVSRSCGDDATILAVGTVERRKNLEVLVRAIARIPYARLISVGPFTPYRDECAALARSLGVDERVQFRGYVSRVELLDLYAGCSVAAVPSRYEGFGYALAQALCAGVPCVAADAASLPEIAAHDVPLVPPGDVAAWAAALRESLGDGARDRARAVRSSAIARFAWEATVEPVLDAYRSAL